MTSSSAHILEALVLILAKQLEGTTADPSQESIKRAVNIIIQQKPTIQEFFRIL